MSSIKIADTHDNEGGLTQFQNLETGLFKEIIFYAVDGILTEWHSYESRDFDGNRQPINIGRPWVLWIIDRLTRAEMAFMMDEYGMEVTITTLNKELNEYHNYNATFIKPDLGEAGWESNTWRQVKFEFRDLVQID